MRCFLPLCVTDLSRSTPQAFHAGAVAFGDTAALRAALATCDEEQRNYSALLSAGDWAAINCDPQYPRRVVVAVDATVCESADGELAAQVALAKAVSWDEVVAIFVDEPAAETAVAAAAHSDQALASLERFDLLWYHPQERDMLSAELTQSAD